MIRCRHGNHVRMKIVYHENLDILRYFFSTFELKRKIFVFTNSNCDARHKNEMFFFVVASNISFCDHIAPNSYKYASNFMKPHRVNQRFKFNSNQF